jgi:hypothetical protein
VPAVDLGDLERAVRLEQPVSLDEEVGVVDAHQGEAEDDGI